MIFFFCWSVISKQCKATHYISAEGLSIAIDQESITTDLEMSRMSHFLVHGTWSEFTTVF